MATRTDTRTPAARTAAAGAAPALRDTVPGKTLVLVAKGSHATAHTWWHHRRALAPASTGVATVAAGSILSTAPTAAEVGAWLLAAAGTTGALWWHRVVRRRQHRDLTGTQAAVWAGFGASGLGVLAAVTADGPLHPLPGIASLAITTIAQATWSIAEHRNTSVTPAPAAEPARTESEAAIWAARIAPEALRDSALTAVKPVTGPDGKPNGFTGLISINVSGPIKHTFDSITADVLKKIGLAYGGVDYANVVVEPSRTGQVPLTVFDRNPLEPTVHWPGPIEPGSPRHLLAHSITGKPVYHDIWVPGYGALHGFIVGTTGSGKSETMLLLLAMERNTRDTAGRPLVASWLLDPQHGASFPGMSEPGRVDVFASDVGDIADVLEGAVDELDRRVRLMAKRGQKLWTPTADEPMIAITLDELLLLLKRAERRMQKRIVEALTIIANGGRKGMVGLKAGTQYPSIDDTGDDGSLRDGLTSGYVILMKTGSRASGPMAAGTRPVGNTSLLPDRFADGSKTPGVAFYLGGTADVGTMVRNTVAEEHWLGDGATGHTGLNPIAAARARREDRVRREDEALAAGERAVITAMTAATRVSVDTELDTWPATEQLLAMCDRPMKTGEIAELLGRPVNVVSQACGRARDRNLVEGDGHRGWVLPQYAAVLGGRR